MSAPRPLSAARTLFSSAACLALLACGDSTGPERDPLSGGVGTGPQRLLSDAEMRTPADADAPAENETWARWVQDNHVPIRSLTSSNYADLQFLKPLLEGKRIVQLGESSHGVADYSEAKVRLIRFLHEEMGFDVIALESGLFECDQADRRVGMDPPGTLQRRCMYSVWQVAEAYPLFQYLAQRRVAPRPLTLAGFDVQPSGNGAQSRSLFLREMVAAVAPSAYADSVARTDVRFRQVTATPGAALTAFLAAEGDRMEAFYLELEGFFARHQDQIQAAFPDRPGVAVVARRTAASVAVYVRALRAPNADASIPIRDRGMADNLESLLTERFPDKKVIVWAHNFHVSYGGLLASPAGKSSMGSWLAERRRAETYTIGLYAYRGMMRSNAGQYYEVYPMPAGSLESILYRARRRHFFVDMAGAPRGPGTEWMYTPRLSHSSGANPETIVPRDQFDAILFIDRVRAPVALAANLSLTR